MFLLAAFLSKSNNGAIYFFAGIFDWWVISNLVELFV